MEAVASAYFVAVAVDVAVAVAVVAVAVAVDVAAAVPAAFAVPLSMQHSPSSASFTSQPYPERLSSAKLTYSPP